MKKWMFLIVCMLPLMGWGQELKQGKYVEWEMEKNKEIAAFTFEGKGVMVFTELGFNRKTKETEYQLEWLDTELSKVKIKKSSFKGKIQTVHNVNLLMQTSSWESFRAFKGEDAIYLMNYNSKNGNLQIITHQIETLDQTKFNTKFKEYENGMFDILVLNGKIVIVPPPDEYYKFGKSFPYFLFKNLYTINIESGKKEEIELYAEDPKKIGVFENLMRGIEFVEDEGKKELWIKVLEKTKEKGNGEMARLRVFRFDEFGEKLSEFTIDSHEEKFLTGFNTIKIPNTDDYLLLGLYSLYPTYQPFWGIFSAIVSDKGEIKKANYYDYDQFDSLLSYFEHTKVSYQEWKDKKIKDDKTPHYSPVEFVIQKPQIIGDEIIFSGLGYERINRTTAPNHDANGQLQSGTSYVFATEYKCGFMALFNIIGEMKSHNVFEINSKELGYGTGSAVIIDKNEDELIAIYPFFDLKYKHIAPQIKNELLTSKFKGIHLNNESDDETLIPMNEFDIKSDKKGDKFISVLNIGHGILRWEKNKYLFFNSAYIENGSTTANRRKALYMALIEYAPKN